MIKQISLFVFSLLICLSLGGCHGHHHAPGHGHEGHDHAHEAHVHSGDEHDTHQVQDAHEGHRHSPNTVIFTSEQAAMIDFALEEATRENVGLVIPTAARIQPTPGGQRELIAKASGIVAFPERNITEGREVKQGETLFYLECGGMMENSIHQYYSETQNEYEKARTEYERKKKLAAEKIVSESDMLQARTEYENAAAKYKHLRENFKEDRQVVSSPLTGYIKQINVTNGQFVQAGDVMMSVSQNRKLFLQADLSVKYYPFLKDIKEVNLREMNSSRAYSLEELHGRLVSYGQSAQKDNPLIPVIFEIDNVIEAVPGTFVNLYIKTSGEAARLSVPNTALVEEMGNYFVFVREEEEEYEKRPVTVGLSDGFRTEILSGLHEGETIVSRGAQIVRLAQGSSALDPHAGHHH